ncbi:hypothetical protein ID866_1014 [Astraeus odoratus]|nr:hypothetical protein ID866_1014 [Astraeus odoratus]
MAEETIFSKIIRREIPSDIVYQDELVTAFRDISPQAPTHILIIPNILIPTVNDVKTEHEVALGRMLTVAAKIAEQEGIAEDGYRLIMNCNRHGGQEVYHIHMHLLGGRPLGPMLAHKALVMTMMVVGCSTRPAIPVSDEQTLVMESSVLAAGITAQQPALTISEIKSSASSTLYNERNEPVTVHYRFFWYDVRGLEMHPLEAPRSVTLPARSSVTLYDSASYLGAHKVRLYLYL